MGIALWNGMIDICNYNHGVKHGKQIMLFANGNKFETTFNMGKWHGLRITYYADGTQTVQNFCNGVI
jgi:antitoxin component YwqK of YwqJK toxin-antitoxin module